jgi:hypothetical protein
MSKINQKSSFENQSEQEDYVSPKDFIEQQEVKMMPNNDVQQNQPVTSAQETGLDVNLIISSFQEKLAQLTTELVVKDATIKQLTNIINNMRGQK